MKYPRNAWYVACTEDDLTGPGPVAARVLDDPLVVWRTADGVAVLEDRCVHRAAALSLGRCEGSRLRCMYHGLVFDASGKVVEIPGQPQIPPQARVRSYPATTRHGWIWVWMGDPALADDMALPGFYEGVEPGEFIFHHGVLDFDAEARLISDNLLDFSHLPFVHAASFGSPEEWADSTPTMLQAPNGLRFQRWIENAKSGGALPTDANRPVDDWMGYDYYLPGVLLMWAGSFPAGTAKAVNFGPPDFSTAIENVNTNVQAITPVTERTSRYFFMSGGHREQSAGATFAAKLAEVTVMAFHEDKRMIEAQQRAIDRDPSRPIMPTVHDRGVTLYNRMKERLLAQEADHEHVSHDTTGISIAAVEPV